MQLRRWSATCGVDLFVRLGAAVETVGNLRLGRRLGVGIGGPRGRNPGADIIEKQMCEKAGEATRAAGQCIAKVKKCGFVCTYHLEELRWRMQFNVPTQIV
jgi:hypothetical protein